MILKNFDIRDATVSPINKIPAIKSISGLATLLSTMVKERENRVFSFDELKNIIQVIYHL